MATLGRPFKKAHCSFAPFIVLATWIIRSKKKSGNDGFTRSISTSSKHQVGDEKASYMTVSSLVLEQVSYVASTVSPLLQERQHRLKPIYPILIKVLPSYHSGNEFQLIVFNLHKLAPTLGEQPA